MKRSFLLFSLAFTLIAFGATAQKFEPLDPSPMDAAFFPTNVPKSDFNGAYVPAKMKIVYGRPQLKGRVMMGSKDVPMDKLWRFGANEASEITFYQDVMIGSTKVSAGTYSIAAIPTQDKWTFVLNSKLNTWGAYTLKNGGSEVARVDGPVSKSNETIEALSMMFKEVDGGVHLVVGWENTIAEMPIKF